jgi:hypothetical protein
MEDEVVLNWTKFVGANIFKGKATKLLNDFWLNEIRNLSQLLVHGDE